MAYFDANATEPLRPAARAAVLAAMEAAGNPSSVHAAGRAARRVLEEARARLELNYQVLAGLEQFFLRLLRLFALRARA